jgi:hypothetical protein
MPQTGEIYLDPGGTTPAATRPHQPTARRQARTPGYPVTPQEVQAAT